MGNSQSNSINAQLNQIMEDSVSSPNVKASETPVINIKPTEKKDAPKVKYVKTETETAAPGLISTGNTTSPAPVGNVTLSATSPAQPSQVAASESATSPAPVPAAVLSATSPAPVQGSVLSATSSDGSVTSNASVPAGMTFSSTSDGVKTDRSKNRNKKKMVQGRPSSVNVVLLNPQIFMTSEDAPKVATTAPMIKQSGGYSYAGEGPTLTGGYSYAGEGPTLTGGVSVIKLDSAIFDSEIEGGNNEEKKSSEFNPEKFFNDMQKGGLREPRNREHKKNRIERYLDPSLEDDDSGFDFAESTEGLDIDENEDTEDIKQKVKTLRAMVSRSKGKKSKGRKSSKKSKRMTESSGGASENSISSYLNSTSSISTSDVRLISMNKMRK